MKSIICHFYNEEYLLPWWLEHHKKYFDYGLMINYKSTDRSVEIINEICPEWQVVDSVNPEFSAAEVDDEVMYYEEQIPGWKIALNVTEFLVEIILFSQKMKLQRTSMFHLFILLIKMILPLLMLVNPCTSK